MEKFSIGLVQMACSADPSENLAKAVARVREAARAGAKIVCLPELFRSRYFCQREDPAVFDLAERVPGPTTQALGRAAQENGVAVIAPVFERRAPRLYPNNAAVIHPGGEPPRPFREMAPPPRPPHYQKFYFSPPHPALPPLPPPPPP